MVMLIQRGSGGTVFDDDGTMLPAIASQDTKGA